MRLDDDLTGPARVTGRIRRPREDLMTTRPSRFAAAIAGSAALAATAALALGAAAVPAAAAAPVPNAAPAATAGACSPAVDLVGFSDAYDKKALAGVPVGGLSALAVSGHRLYALSDRSSLFSAPATGPMSLDAGRATVARLTGGAGQQLDSEGLAVDRDGTLLVTSETEPSINRFSTSGTYLGQLPVPTLFQLPPVGDGVPNGTFEGLTTDAGARHLFTMNEVPRPVDGGLTRLLEYDRNADGYLLPGAQYAYHPDAGLGVPEIQSVDDHRFLVLERGYTPGVGNTVRLYLADDTGAADVSERSALGGTVKHPMAKQLLADLVTCPPDGAAVPGAQQNPLLDNIEGMAILSRSGPAGEALRVLMVSDDNDNPTQTTRLYLFDVRVPGVG